MVGYDKRIFLFEQGVVGLSELFLLDLSHGVSLCVAHGPEGIEFIFDLLVGPDDFLNGLEGLLVFFLVVDWILIGNFLPQPADFFLLTADGGQQLRVIHKLNI